MPVKIRLQRQGKKGNPFYHIVIADGRAPRDGKFIEKIGAYNPTTNPATIQINTDAAVSWLQKGAQPTDTCRSLLSAKGVMYKNHLLGGVTKGALTKEQADAKLEKWLNDKEGKIAGDVTKKDDAKKEAYKARMNAETLAKETKAAKVLAKNSALTEEPTAASEVTEAPATEEEPKADA